jgi:glycosyltransferase involved in cell wall biosynthesis
MADQIATPVTAPLATPAARPSALFVTPVAPWILFGGTPTVSRNLVALFSEAMDLQVCCLRSDEPGDYPLQTNGATVLTGKVSALSRRLKLFLDFSPESFAHRQFQKSVVRERFAALLAEQRPECIIFDHIYSSWLIDLVPDSGTLVIYIAHDDMVSYADSLLCLRPGFLKRLRFTGLRRQYRSLQEKVLRRCDYTLTMTAEDAALFQSTARGPVEVAPLFFEFPDFVREYTPDFRYLLITGSFDTWEKKLGLTEFLTTIFPSLLKRCPELRLVVAGRISEDFRRQIPFHEPQLRIIQAPSETEMREAVRQASAAVVLDLQSSGLKIKAMELAAAGLPLVSWAPGLEGTALVSGQSCLRADSATEFAHHLERLYAEPELRRQLGTAAQAVVQTRFSKHAASARLRTSEWYSRLSAAHLPRSIS